MARARNQVISGDYKGCFIHSRYNLANIVTKDSGNIYLDKSTVEKYEYISNENNGTFNILAAKETMIRSYNIFRVKIIFKDGKESLTEIDGYVYRALIRGCFYYTS